MRDAYLSDVDFPADARVAEIGSGTGAVTRAPAEAFRLPEPGGRLAAFDGDCVTVSVAHSPTDPLQACGEAAENLVHGPWLARRLSVLVRDSGFLRRATAGPQPRRGAVVLRPPPDGRRRSDAAEFHGHINYVSVTARR